MGLAIEFSLLFGFFIGELGGGRAKFIWLCSKFAPRGNESNKDKQLLRPNLRWCLITHRLLHTRWFSQELKLWTKFYFISIRFPLTPKGNPWRGSKKGNKIKFCDAKSQPLLPAFRSKPILKSNNVRRVCLCRHANYLFQNIWTE